MSSPLGNTEANPNFYLDAAEDEDDSSSAASSSHTPPPAHQGFYARRSFIHEDEDEDEDDDDELDGSFAPSSSSDGSTTDSDPSIAESEDCVLTIPFMELLSEIRMLVYQQVVVRKRSITPLELCPSRYVSISNTFTRLDEYDNSHCQRQPPLLRSCRQIRHEALPVYYRENNFKTAKTILLAGCMYPTFRYPNPAAAEPLRFLRQLRMSANVIELHPVVVDDEEASVRVSVALDLDVKLVKQNTDITVKIVEARSKRKLFETPLYDRQRSFALAGAHETWLASTLKSLMGNPAKEHYDGFDLLRAAATMPVPLRGDGKCPGWYDLLPFVPWGEILDQ